jgi:hypothetical protein
MSENIIFKSIKKVDLQAHFLTFTIFTIRNLSQLMAKCKFFLEFCGFYGLFANLGSRKRMARAMSTGSRTLCVHCRGIRRMLPILLPLE